MYCWGIHLARHLNLNRLIVIYDFSLYFRSLMYLRKSHWPKRIVFEKEECFVSFFLNTSGSSEKSSKTKTKGGVLEFKFSVGIIQKTDQCFLLWSHGLEGNYLGHITQTSET